MSHHIIEAHNLSFTYPDGTCGLSDISFRITHGESVALVGANGAGKSTFLLHLNGYLLATSGKIQVGGYPLIPDNLKTIRRAVGMVFQNPDDQLFMPTVFEDVIFGPSNLGLPLSEAEHAAREALTKVGADHLHNRPPYKLSQGEKRAVSIATALAMSPDILVMDEPTAGLDPKSRRGLIEQLKSFHHTKVIATHDLDMAFDLCKRTIILAHGKLVADGPTQAILADKELLESNNLLLPYRLQK